MNWFERLILAVAPRAALKRQAARKSALLLEGSFRRYEGASNSNRFKLWNPSDNSANEEIKKDAKGLYRRARELRRNNPIAHRAIQVISTNVVGTGIKPVFSSTNKRLKNLADTEWERWAEKTTDCDFDGFHNLTGLQSLVMDAVAESGECFIVRSRQSTGRGVPLKLRVLEADYLEHSQNTDDGLAGAVANPRNEIRQGIEFDPSGRRVAYHFFEKHPGEKSTYTQKIRVPAERVIHVYRKQRPGQIRGVTFLHPVMVRLKELDQFQDASLKKQQIAACYSAFIYNSTGDSLENTYSNKTEWELLEKLDSGTIEELPPGYDIKFADPPGIDFYSEFIKTELMAIAAGLGVTYEALTQDYSNVNFSSARMGFLEFQRNIKRWQNDIMVSQMLNRVFDWFVDALQFMPGALNVDPSRISVSWTVPAREMIDPSKEVPAARDAVKAGFKTVSEVIRSQGYNVDEVFEERAKELEMMKELGIKTDSSPEEKPKQVVTRPPSGESDEEEEIDDENQ